MTVRFDSNVLLPKKSSAAESWEVWEKKTFNIHRGVIDWDITESFESIDQIASRIRAGVETEFRPGWFRGFGFGTILHFREVPADCSKICVYIDTRNKKKGVWQWAILSFDEDKRAIGIHTWLHGYLRPAYDSVLEQLTAAGYECESVDSDIDQLIATLRRIARLHPTRMIVKALGKLV